ncbi:nucleotidyltransferase domain-containing protein [Candidatus Woesearchaeota archaeon]|nr:nucleotidyltransferase domain-containing protein [Candidatus Woesearchaeota archaeon]
MKRDILLNKLKKAAKNSYAINTEIVDIIIYGSFVKGKANPKDIDVLVIFNRTIDRTILHEFNAIAKTYSSFIADFPTESIFHEGYSLVYEKRISELYHFISAYLFRYSLKNKNKTQRMQFYYALYGRNSKGVLETTKSIKFSDQCILTPVSYADEIKEFFGNQSIEYFSLPIMYPISYENAKRLSVD